LVQDIKMLESVQRNFTLRLPGMRPLQGRYNERLEITDLLTLEKRRLIIDLQYLYRIFMG